MAAVSTSVKPALDSSWLTIDNTNGNWSGKTPYEPDVSDAPNPKVPAGADLSLVDQGYNFAPDSDGVLYESTGWNSAWPGFSQGDWVQGPIPRPEIQGQGDNGVRANPLPIATTNAYVDTNDLAGYDAHSQMTDNKGWDQYTLTGRSATFGIGGDSTPGFKNYWYNYGERPVEKYFANVSVARSGNGVDDSLPDYNNINYGGPGTVAYDTPGAPATTEPQSQAATSWNQWGSF